MAKGFNGELLHFGATRMRINGSGSLKLNFSGLNNYNLSALPNMSMQPQTNIEPLILADHKDQYGVLTGYLTDIDDYFKISKIVIFVKPIATGYPQ